MGSSHLDFKKFYLPSSGRCAREASFAADSPVETESMDHPALTKKDIEKLHAQLKHGTKTATINYIRAAGKWYSSIDPIVDKVLRHCSCRLAFPPTPHAKLVPWPLTTDTQRQISIDVNHFEGKNFFPSVDECTASSESRLFGSKANRYQNHNAQ